MSGPTYNGNGGVNMTTGTSGTLSVTGVATNDTIVLFVMNFTNAAGGAVAPTSVVDSQTGTPSYTGLGTWQTSAYNIGGQIFVLTNAASGSHTVTITWPSSVSPAVMWGTYSNTNGSFVDQYYQAFTNTSSTTLSAPMTNSYSNGTVICAASTYGGAAASSYTGTLRFNGGGIGVSAQTQDQTQSGSGLVTPSWTYSAATSGLIFGVTLQNTVAAGGGGLLAFC